MNKIFKNENSVLGKIEKFFWKLWEKEPFRFLVAGGINTLIGLIITIIARCIFDYGFGWNPKLTVGNWNINGYEFFSFDIPSLISFVVNLPIAYTLQTTLAFRTKWAWRRLARYPLSSIPNFILNQLCILIFEVWLGVHPVISYILAAVLPLPIMFFIIRFLVKPIKKLSKKETPVEEKEEAVEENTEEEK